ncbi:MAG TPA: lysylphosphatidylglycerol synthase domain-containing protein [Longimicrobium sp.]
MKLRISPAARRVLGVLFIVAAALFLARTIYRNWGQLGEAEWRVNPLRLAASIVAQVMVLAWGVWVWSRVQRHFEHAPVPLSALMRIWFLSTLARYVPGMQIVAVAQLSRTAGLSGAVLLTSMAVHTGLALLSALLISAWSLPEHLAPGIDPRWAGAAATAAALLLVHPATLNYPLGLLRRVLKRDVVRWGGSWVDGVGLLGLSVLSWVFYGGAYYLFLDSLVPLPASTIVPLAGVNALSFAIGFLSPSPGGGGVREVAMQGLLGPIFPAAVAAVLSVAARLWSIAAELIGGGAVLWLTRRRGERPSAPPA